MDWALAELKPKVAVAQLKARYQSVDAGEHRIRHQPDPIYDRRLFQSLERALELCADFILFPEYSWPRVLSQQVLDLASQRMRIGTVWLLPFEHLRVGEFRSLMSTMPVPDDVHAEVMLEVEAGANLVDPSAAYVNVCFVLLKTGSGVVAIPQTKTQGAALEERDLVGSKHLYVVHGQNCRFATFICFDIIARDESHSERPREAIVVEGATPDLLFIPECNPSPLHHSYARAVIDLFEDPQLAPSPPVIVFGNVAAGSDLPALGADAHFGFSRIIGRLGDVATSENVAIVHDGVIAAERYASLSDLERPPNQMALPTIRSLVARPQESLLVVQLPRIGTGPSRDPTAGRANTTLEAFRWVDTWQRVRASVEHTPRREQLGVPQGLFVVDGLVGAEQLMKELRTALREAPSPVWISGQGGVGKTALAAAVLREIERAGTANILWVDLSEVAPEQDALREHLLLKLGLSAGLLEKSDAQWELLQMELSNRPIILVLDSRELWRVDALPPEVTTLNRWPSRVIVTARNRPSPSSAPFTMVDVTPLDAESSRVLIKRDAPPEIADTTIARLAEFADGSPLACMWIAGALRSRDNGLLQAVRSANELDESALQAVFIETTRRLSDTERDVLLVLSCLPSPLTEGDLEDICGFPVDRIHSAISELQDRHLVLATTNEGVHAAHPFVRQFVVVWPRRPEIQERLYSWADRRLRELGGDRNWASYPKLNDVWPNIESIIQLLRTNNPREFLRLWRMSDYFLWSSGRRRERERLGLLAVDIAKQTGDDHYLVHALYDAVAESRWHRSGEKDECISLLDEAMAVASRMADSGPHQAMIEHYRSRMLRQFGKLDEAMSAAQRAVQLAAATDSELVLGLCENALGNVFRTRREYELALSHFEKAARHFSKPIEPEMMAIVLRNQGRCHAKMGQYGRAIEEFEGAVAGLRDLHLHVECAEAALDHAQTLAELGEHEEAAAEAANARELFASLGALHLLEAADNLLSRIRRS